MVQNIISDKIDSCKTDISSNIKCVPKAKNDILETDKFRTDHNDHGSENQSMAFKYGMSLIKKNYTKPSSLKFDSLFEEKLKVESSRNSLSVISKNLQFSPSSGSLITNINALFPLQKEIQEVSCSAKHSYSSKSREEVEKLEEELNRVILSQKVAEKANEIEPAIKFSKDKKKSKPKKVLPTIKKAVKEEKAEWSTPLIDSSSSTTEFYPESIQYETINDDLNENFILVQSKKERRKNKSINESSVQTNKRPVHKLHSANTWSTTTLPKNDANQVLPPHQLMNRILLKAWFEFRKNY